MNKLIVDHLRRWFLLWLLIGIGYIFNAGWALSEGDMFAGIFAAFSFQLLFLTGVFPLNYDFQRRHFQAVFILPLTARQIGRAWWVVCVGWPALLLALAQALGMLISSVMHKSHLSLQAYLATCFFNALFLGMVFFIIIAGLNRRPQTRREYVEMTFFSVLGIYAIIQLFRLAERALSFPETIAFILIGSLVTVSGFVSAGYFVSRRAANFRLTGKSGQSRPKESRRSDFHGINGIPLLFLHTFKRIFLGWLAIFLAMVGVFIFSQHDTNDSILTFLGSALPTLFFFPAFIVIMLQITPMIQHLRALRSLPLNTPSLALLLVLLPLSSLLIFFSPAFLPLLLTGSLNKNPGQIYCYLAGLNAFTLCIPFLVYFGLNQITMVAAIFLMSMASIPVMLLPNWFTLPAVVLLSIIALPLSIFLTRKCLNTSSKAYRPVPNLPGNAWGWGWGR